MVEVEIDHPDHYDEEQIDCEGERFMGDLLGNSSTRLPSGEDLLTRPSKSPQKQGAEFAGKGRNCDQKNLSSNNEESDYAPPPTKKAAPKMKTKQGSKSTKVLTAAELAMDNPTDNEDSEGLLPVTSPDKGKRRASNSKNVNPKSCSASNGVTRPFVAFEDYAKKKKEGKKKEALDSIGFEKMKYNRAMEKELTGIALEEKKFEHAKTMADKRWDRAIQVEEKKLDDGVKIETAKLQWEAAEKEKDCQFEIKKLETQGGHKNKAKKLEVLAKLIDSGKSYR
ncbi:hypothetical protein PSHT_08314 [Puccinia striiformis]|uniref:Uncharacterized protein n=1 Tax=Puccinia striiformis TaxID=27350 RepID=A0A2S4VQ57_9BASI|nr:hypothetical protein PSHT_08314 [Puccinia striiformis]